MTHTHIRSAFLLLALLAALALTACGGPKKDPAEPTPPPMEAPVETPATQPETESLPTLKELCGDDYAAYIEETILMQMENRMADRNPDVEYYPIVEEKPLSAYVNLDETLSYTMDEEGSPVIRFPLGAVTDKSNGEQTFRVPKVPQ